MSSGQHMLIIGLIAAVVLHACLLWLRPQPVASLPNQSATAIFLVDAVAANSQPVQEVAPAPDDIPEQITEEQVSLVKAKPSAPQHKKMPQQQKAAIPVVELPVESPAPASIPTAVVSTEPVFVDKPQFVSPPIYPAYPSLAHRRGQQGTVWLEIWLSESGKQIRLSIARSSGFSMLDEAAKTAAESWEFLPYRLNGMTVASRVKVPVEFVIQ